MRLGDRVIILETSEKGVITMIEESDVGTPIVYVDCTEHHGIGPIEPVALNRFDLEYVEEED